MHILQFLASYWSDIVLILILIAVAITIIIQWVKVKGPIFNAMSSAEKIAYVKRLLVNLLAPALVLVTDAEVEYGGGTGVIKRAYVIGELYKLIPDEFKKYITEENLDAIINKVLPEAKKLWEAKPSTLLQIKP